MEKKVSSEPNVGDLHKADEPVLQSGDADFRPPLSGIDAAKL